MLLTRAPDQGPDFARLLEERGAQVRVTPLIVIGPPPSERQLRRAVDRADEFNWLIFTSAVGVEAFARRRTRALPAHVRVAAIGPATAQAVAQQLGRRAEVVPERFTGEALADEIVKRADARDSMLIIAATDARAALPARLRAANFSVEKVDGYTTLEAPPPDLEAQIAGSDVITLASPSAVRALVRGLGERTAAAKLRGKLLACIGPVTLLEARQLGLHVEISPQSATLPALVDAICAYYTTPRSQP